MVIRQRLNQLGYGLKRVFKTKPIKQIPETGAIFKEVNRINQQADDDPTTLRISMDAKVGIKVGEFDRGGKTRVPTVALDHDFCDCSTLTPYGIFLPEAGELFLFFVQSKLTADCIVDLLEDWWLRVKERFADIRKIVINQDNGPENNRCGKLTPFSANSISVSYFAICSEVSTDNSIGLLSTLPQ